MPDVTPFFGPCLRELREAKRMSVSDLADASGVSRQTITHYEAGRRDPNLRTLLALAYALGVRPEKFLRDS